jgi:hypothetical protein
MRVGCTIVPLALMLMGTVAVARPPLRDAPVVWDAGDTQPIAVPEYFEPKFTEYTVEASLSRPFARLMNPGRWLRGLFSDQSVPDAANVNSLDEVPGGAWFTNRIGLYPLTNAELAAGNGAAGPDTSAPWVVIGAKSGGVATGFRIRDACGDVYLIKFDPPDYPGTTIHAGVVANLIFYACGYHVPEDQVVAFTRDQVIAAPEAQIKDSDGSKVVLDGRRLDAFLAATGVVYDGRYHALASKFLPGKPLGPFDYLGRRQDDPNDTVRHENRRELRGLRMIAAWLNHFDTKAQNSLDMYRTPLSDRFREHARCSSRQLHVQVRLRIFVRSGRRFGPTVHARGQHTDLGGSRASAGVAGGRILGRRTLPAPEMEAGDTQQRVREHDAARRLLGGEDHLGVHGRRITGDRGRGSLP